MEVHDDGKRNPLIFIGEDDVRAWLRQKADEAGYADRSLSAVQIRVEPDGPVLQGATPELVLMVSNIPNSR